MNVNTETLSVYQSLDEAVVVCDDAMLVVWLNRSAIELFEPQIACLKQALPAASLDALGCWQTACLLSGQKVQFIVTAVTQNEYVFVIKQPTVKSIPILSISNQAVVFDANLFKTLFDEAAAGIVLFSIDNELVKANAAFCSLLGYKEIELIGRNLVEFTHLEDIHIDDLLKNKLTSKSSAYYQIEKRFLHKDGHTITALISVSLVRDVDDNPSFFVQQMIDIGKRKATEQALRMSERKFLSLFNDSPNLYLTLSPSSLTITDSNRLFTLSTGFSKESLVGRSLLEFIAVDDLELFKTAFADLQRNGSIANFEHRLRCTDGNVFFVSLNASIIYSKTDVPVFYVFSWRDISEQKRITEELRKSKEEAEQSDRLKSAFLSNMSHEIRTPMNGIIGFTELLTRSNLKPEQVKKYGQIIKDRGADLIRIIDDILDISKLEAGAIKIKYESAYLSQILLSVYQLMQTKLEKENKTHIPLRITEKLVKLRLHFVTDVVRLQQVLINLIDNAIKFTSEGEIVVDGELLADNRLQISVKDSGIGISDEFKEVIFGRFRQAEMHSARKYGGNGLGLAICKGLIQLMNGDIWVESAYMQGTTFFLQLPIEIIEKETIKQTEQFDLKMNMTPDWGTKTVLLVEDDAVSAELMQELLSETNVQLLHVDNGSEALKQIKSKPTIDLVLMDIRLPDISGLDVTKQVKAFRSSLPIIAQTAFAMEEERRRFLEAGCDDYLSKPIERDQLIEKISRFFQ